MKAMWQCLAPLVLVAVALVGCAASSPNGTTGASADGTDWAQVNAVDRVARRAGVEVHWVNYPQKQQP